MNRSNFSQQIQQKKKFLRQKYLTQRQQLSTLEWQKGSENICAHLLNSGILNRAKVILSYLSFKQEPDLTLLHQQSLYIWGLPRCQGKNLIWHQYHPADKLVKGIYGISEPHPDSPVISPAEVGLILVPALAIDQQGNRLGYGGGYYDRLFSKQEWQNIPTIGIIFNFAYVAQLETELWDQSVNYVCTEMGIQKIRSSKEQK